MISKLVVENFLSIDDIYLEDIDEMDIVGISGQYKNKTGYSNGSGKSSLAETIWYAFTGNHRYKKDIDVVRINQSSAHILLEYKYLSETITIERFIKIKKKRDGTNTSALIKYDSGEGEEIVASGTNESQQWINNYFGINEDAFLKSFFFRQKEYDKLMKSRPGERLKFIEDFLGASIFDKAKRISAGRRNELDIEIRGIDIQIETLQEKLLTSEETKNKKIFLKDEKLNLNLYKKNLETSENLKEKYVKEIAEKEEKLKILGKNLVEKDSIKEELKTLKSTGKTLEKKKKNHEEWINTSKNTIKSLKNKLSKIEKNDVTEKTYEEFDKLKNNRESLLISIASEESILKQIEKSKKNIDIGDCPVCYRNIDEKMMKSLAYKYDSKIKKTQIQIKDRKEGLNKIDTKINNLELSIKNKEKNDENIKNTEQRIKIKETELKGDKKILQAFEEQYELLKKQFKSLTNRYKELEKINTEEIIIPYDEKETTDKAIKELKKSIEKSNNNIKEIRTEIDNNIEVKKNINVLTKKRKFRSKEIKYRIKLDSVFNKCRMEIISTGLRELENNSTNIISNLGATQKEVIWSTQKETLKGNIKDSLDIYLKDEKGERLIEGLSGAEWDLTAFSSRASLARYKLSRMNSKIDFMVLDEIFGSLDEGSREELISVINMFKEEFSQVFVISHTDLKESFGHNIKVEMGTDGITRLL